MTPSSITSFVLTAALAVTLSACSEKELILKGERTAVLPALDFVTIDADAAGEGAQLGSARINRAFTHAGGTSGHAIGHLSLSESLSPIWQASIEKAPDITVELAQPVIANDAVYALGGDGRLHALNLNDGTALWTQEVEVLIDEPLPGVAGGVAASDNHIVAHASQFDLVSLDPTTGEVRWRVTHPERLKGGPTLVNEEGVLVSDVNGELYLYDLKTGAGLWQRAGLPTNTVVFGAPAPAFAAAEVVLAGAGGEIAIYDPASGDLLWADSLASLNPRTPLQELGDVLAHPVHDGSLLFVISQSGRMVAFQAATGIEIWEQPISSIEMPWVAGDTIFVTSVDGRLYSLRRNDGAARWITEMPGALPLGTFASENIPSFSMPVVASERVYVLDRNGHLRSYNAQTGAQLSDQSLSGTFTTPPTVAQESLILLNHQGTLFVYR